MKASNGVLWAFVSICMWGLSFGCPAAPPKEPVAKRDASAEPAAEVRGEAKASEPASREAVGESSPEPPGSEPKAEPGGEPAFEPRTEPKAPEPLTEPTADGNAATEPPPEPRSPDRAPAPAWYLPLGVDHMKLKDFNGTTVPLNHAGNTYPSQYPGEGKGSVHIDAKDAVFGSSLRLHLLSGKFYAQFNPRLPQGRDFCRDYVEFPKAWKYNTYNRLSFWIKMPKEAMPPSTSGQDNVHFGTYVKRIANADKYSDEAGGGHWYHQLNIPNTATWTKVIINMHPHHLRSASGNTEHGNQPHPTKEPKYNYFDTLTRFYISQQRTSPTRLPSELRLDEFYFYRMPKAENDAQVYSIAATYVASSKKVILTWSRHKDENKISHCIKYAFRDIHVLGWSKATDAPSGCVKPQGHQGYNKMVYETTQIPVGQNKRLFLAIRPQGAALFSQIDLPILP